MIRITSGSAYLRAAPAFCAMAALLAGCGAASPARAPMPTSTPPGVYVATVTNWSSQHPGPTYRTVSALTPGAGAVRWQRREEWIPFHVSDSTLVVPAGPGYMPVMAGGAPVVAAGVVYMVGDTNTMSTDSAHPPSGVLLALRASDGQQLWRVDVGAYASQPVVDGDTIYISAEPTVSKSFAKEVYALNRSDGSVRWKTEITKTQTTMDTLVLSQGRLFMSANQICFDACYAAYLFALDTASGHILWQRSFSGNINIQTPTVDDGVVYTRILNGGALFALSAVDGRQLWQRDVGNFQVADGVVYTDKTLSTTDPQRSDLEKYAVVALDGKTGAQRWQTPTITDPMVLAVVKGKVVVYSDKPNPQAPQSASPYLAVTQALDASTGKQLWSAQEQGYGFIVSAASGTFYLIISPTYIGGRQQVAALQAASGDILWRGAIGAGTPGVLQHDFGIISPMGGVFCLASPNFLYAIRTTDGHTLWTANLTNSGQIVGATIVE